MKRVLTAVVLIPVVLLVLFKAPLWLFTLVVGMVAMGAAWEYFGLLKGYGLEPLATPAFAVSSVVFIYMASFFFFRPTQVAEYFNIFLWLTPFVILASAMSRTEFRAALPSAM